MSTDPHAATPPVDGSPGTGPGGGDDARPARSARRLATIGLRWVAVGVVIGACALLAGRLDLPAVASTLRRARLPLVAVAATLNFAIVALRARVLHVLLREQRLVPTSRLVRYNLVGYALNNLLPGRAGDVVRLYLLKARESVPVGSALAVAVLERVMEALSLLVIAAPLALLVPDLPAWARTTLAVLSGLGLVGVAVAFGLARFGGDASHASRFFAGLARVRRPRTFVETLALSAAVWLLDATNIVLCAAAVGLPLHPVIGPLLVLLALSFALAVPSTPAQLGAFELACVAALEITSAPREQSLAFALVYHAMQIVPVTLAGLPGLRYVAEATASARGEAGQSR